MGLEPVSQEAFLVFFLHIIHTSFAICQIAQFVCVYIKTYDIMSLCRIYAIHRSACPMSPNASFLRRFRNHLGDLNLPQSPLCKNVSITRRSVCVYVFMCFNIQNITKLIKNRSSLGYQNVLISHCSLDRPWPGNCSFVNIYMCILYVRTANYTMRMDTFYSIIAADCCISSVMVV